MARQNIFFLVAAVLLVISPLSIAKTPISEQKVQRVSAKFVEVEILLSDDFKLADISAVPTAPGSDLKVLDDPKRVVAQLPVSIVKGLLDAGTWTHSDIVVSGAPASATVTCIDVHYEIKHTCRSDLDVDLNDEDLSCEQPLWRGGGGQICVPNINETKTGITACNGERVNQIWRLFVKDRWIYDTGYIDYWWIKVYYDEIPPPPHDDCTNAIPVLEAVPYEGSTVGATGVDESSCGFNDTADVWHRFTATGSGIFLFSLCGSEFDTTLAVFDECGGTELACNDDRCDLQSELFLSLDAGQSCVIRIAGFDGETGSYKLVVETIVSPPNDECVNAIPVLEAVPYEGRTHLATGIDESVCGDNDVADVWHSYTPTSTGLVTISLCGSEFDTTLAVFDGCGGTELACNDDSCDVQSEVCVSLNSGQSYMIRVAGYRGNTGSYVLTVTPNPPVLPSQPSGPGPADGATDVSVDATLLWNCGATETNQVNSSRTVTASLKAATMVKAIYGRDDRIEEYQVTDTNILTAGDSTAILVPYDSLIDNSDGTFSLPSETFADWYYATVGIPLCDDEPFRDQPTPGQCSAVLVAPNIIATAGHCAEPQDCSDLAVVFGFVMLDAETPVLTIDKSDVYYCTEVIGRQVGEPDWGLIYLDREVTGHRPLPIRHTGVIADGEPLLVIGNPMGVPRKYAAGATVRDNTASSYFLANLDVYIGSSGSAVLNADTLLVEGILYAGALDFITRAGESCDRSSMCPDSGCQGYPRLEYVSRVTEFAPVIPLFDVYLGTDTGQLDLICSDNPIWSCDPGPLKTGTTYYWQVVSKNCYDQAEGPIWSFTTE